MQSNRILIYGIHRTSKWWGYLGKSVGLGKSAVVTDLRNEGDISIVDDFYRNLKKFKKSKTVYPVLLNDSDIKIIISRCRLLRWLDINIAQLMVHSMALSFEKVLDKFQPTVLLSFPIDRYVSDILARRATARKIPYLEVTASPFFNMSMFLYQGKLIKSQQHVSPSLVDKKIKELISPIYSPTYVSNQKKYNLLTFFTTLSYFKIRAIIFKLISIVRRDPLNLHYLDSQQFLGHKCRWKDVKILSLIDVNWKSKLSFFNKKKRVFFGLQLFPEASIDYWIQPTELIDYENLVVEAAKKFSGAGYLILIKDHPMQFGFRHTDLIVSLLQIENVVLVPYEISAHEMLALSGVSFTFTGTLGLQAALAGIKSVVTENYYSNEDDFIIFHKKSDIQNLPLMVENKTFKEPLDVRRKRIVSNLLSGCFDGDIFTFKNFNSQKPSQKIDTLAKSLKIRIMEIISEIEI